ncbi:MAG: TIGR03032 family protein, partial [Gemmataceae bacterium]
MNSTPASTNTPVEPPRSVHTSTLPELLEQLGISILFSTYQAGKLVAVRAENGQANTHFRDFNTPMGIAIAPGRFSIGTKTTVVQFQNQAALGKKLPAAPRAYDACFLPRSVHYTGNIGIHEMAYANDELWIVNTRFSCLCTLEQSVSFVPRWRPSFISGLALEDRCHLNGLGLRDGKPRYVTAHGATDTPAGWRETKHNGGILMDVPSNDFIARGLSMPHSPRWYDGKLWVLESGAGTLNTVDLATGQLTTVAALPGFTRGLEFFGPFAFIGLSQVRESAVFSGIPITNRLKPEERCCGLWVVDVRNGNIVAFLQFQSMVQEVFS